MDHDVYTTNDAIGLVYVDLSPLFMRTAERDQENRDLVVQGWFPLYDTLRGVRGALCLVIKVLRGAAAAAVLLSLGIRTRVFVLECWGRAWEGRRRGRWQREYCCLPRAPATCLA